ncbi:MAG: precorrin-3B C(17)-methyltransferase [Deltaproteobacteria bacterium]|nr:precorrin-3B C(17)-methyltransferase [Deltaproteobacteria bacterium]
MTQENTSTTAQPAVTLPTSGLTVVGIGPGDGPHITPAALEAIAQAQVVVGYNTYIKLVTHLLEGKDIIRTGMTEEIARVQAAVEAARTRRVALISSGDAGVYGTAALVFQVLEQQGWRRGDPPNLEIVPGITALNACASLVGAPLGHDFAAISLSDLLTPWSVIVKRLRAAAQADFVTGLYNPASGRRTQQIVEAQEIFSAHRPPETPVALVKSAYRRRQQVNITTLSAMLEDEIGMLTTVIIGSTQTRLFQGYMVTPRGYGNKYTEDGQPLPGQTPGRSLVVEQNE